MPVKLVKDEESFSRFVNGKRLVVSFFFVPWCPKCRHLSPIFRKFSNIYPHVEFIKIDCMEFPEMSQHKDAPGFPTILFFQNKQRGDQLIGGDACQLWKKIEAHCGGAVDAQEDEIEWTEFEPEAIEDKKLGSNSQFLLSLKKNCKEAKKGKAEAAEKTPKTQQAEATKPTEELKLVASAVIKAPAEETTNNQQSTSVNNPQPSAPPPPPKAVKKSLPPAAPAAAAGKGKPKKKS